MRATRRVDGIPRRSRRLNRAALQLIPAQAQLVTIEGATHLFEEPGTLEQVAQQAADWFARWLR